MKKERTGESTGEKKDSQEENEWESRQESKQGSQQDNERRAIRRVIGSIVGEVSRYGVNRRVESSVNMRLNKEKEKGDVEMSWMGQYEADYM